MLEYVFLFIGIFFSPMGLFAFGFGILQFFLAPVVPRVTNHFHSLAGLHSWLGTTMLKRAAVVVTKQGDLLLKRSSPTGLGTETMTVDGEEKEIEDPASRQSTWHGIPFGLVEGVHAIFFDPRDAALGARKRKHEEQAEMVVQATERERDLYGHLGWVRGVFEFPKGQYELPDLASVRELIAGAERGEHPGRVEKFYELSREPYNSGASTARLIMLIVALMGPLFGIWIMTDQFGSPSSTVSFGLFLLLLSGPSAVRNVNWKRVATAVMLVLPLPLAYLFLLLITGPLYATVIFVIMGMGFWLIPVLLLALKAVDSIAESGGRLFLKTGLMGYDVPVWELTPDGYTVRELSNLNDAAEENVTLHYFLSRTVGFTFTPSEDSWGTEVVDRDEINNVAIADGGNDKVTPSNVPPGCERVPDRGRAVYGDFVPSKRDRSNYYIASGISMRRIAEAARGNRSHNRLLQAKEQHGGESGLDDRTLMIAMSVLGLISFGIGVVVFLL